MGWIAARFTCICALHACIFVYKSSIPSLTCVCNVRWYWALILVLGVCEATRGLAPFAHMERCLRTSLSRSIVSSCGTLCVRTAQKSHHRGLEGLVLHCVVEPVKLHLVYPCAQISWWIHPTLQHVHVLLRIRFMFFNFWEKKSLNKQKDLSNWSGFNGDQLY